MRQIFVHLHIPKCGGISVANLLRMNFGANLSTTNSILNDYQYSAAQVARIIDHFPDLECLTGHKLSLDLPFYRGDLDIQAFTWVRDPIDRFISHYFYHRNHTTLVPEAKTMGILEYTDWALEQGNQPMYINGQTQFLSGGSLATIQEKVQNGKLLLFPLSHLQESFYTLAEKYPDTFQFFMLKNMNVSKKDQSLPNKLRDKILPFVEEDLKLLELARQTPLTKESPYQGKKSLKDVSKRLQRNTVIIASYYFGRLARFIERQV